MENKYYTPKLGEFFQGFEYQVLRNNNWEKEDLLYSNKYIKVHGFSYLDSLIQSNKVRVKYLDREDIESLGWKYLCDDKDGRNHSLYKKDKYLISDYRTYDYEDIKIWITGGKVLFQGIIKNKSELIKLLKQLEINEN
jgi:hypothetical protein